ncbi:MAG: PilZ domain-containing protein [Pseudomonadales bacterium]|nr:PilZ domain-containing protein [Pseudomonadales bacterium]
MDEKRKNPRSNRQEDVYIEVMTQNEEGDYAKKIIGCESVDVSREGLRLYVHERIVQGTILDLCMSFRDNPEKFYLTAEVKWSKPLVDEGWYFIGFEVYEADNTDFEKWFDWVDQFSGLKQQSESK